MGVNCGLEGIWTPFFRPPLQGTSMETNKDYHGLHAEGTVTG